MSKCHPILKLQKKFVKMHSEMFFKSVLFSFQVPSNPDNTSEKPNAVVGREAVASNHVEVSISLPLH